MKKILSLALVFAMMMTMSVTAFAATSGESGNVTIDNTSSETPNSLPYSDEYDVLVRLDSDGDGIYDSDDDDDATSRIIVDLAWTDMTFVYSKSWDPDTLTSTEGWTNDDQYISVTNKGEIWVDAEFSYADNEKNSVDNVIEFSVREVDSAKKISNATFADNTLTLDNPAVTALSKDSDGNAIAPYAEIAVNPTKAPSTDTKETVGTITLTIKETEFTYRTVVGYEVSGYASYNNGETNNGAEVTKDTIVSFSLVHSDDNYNETTYSDDEYSYWTVTSVEDGYTEPGMYITVYPDNTVKFNNDAPTGISNSVKVTFTNTAGGTITVQFNLRLVEPETPTEVTIGSPYTATALNETLTETSVDGIQEVEVQLGHLTNMTHNLGWDASTITFYADANLTTALGTDSDNDGRVDFPTAVMSYSTGDSFVAEFKMVVNETTVTNYVKFVIGE